MGVAATILVLSAAGKADLEGLVRAPSTSRSECCYHFRRMVRVIVDHGHTRYLSLQLKPSSHSPKVGKAREGSLNIET